MSSKAEKVKRKAKRLRAQGQQQKRQAAMLRSVHESLEDTVAARNAALTEAYQRGWNDALVKVDQVGEALSSGQASHTGS